MKTSLTPRAYHHEVCQVQPDSALAHRLSSDCQRAPFDRLWWWQALESWCALPGQLHGIEITDGEAMLALRDAGHGHLVSLANWYTFRFRPILNGNPIALDLLAKTLKSRAHRITLDKVPDEDGSMTALASAFRKAGWLVVCEPCDTNHILPVAARSFDTYIQTRPGPLRTTLKRKSGKVSTQVLTHFDPAAWQAYEDIYAQSWKGEEGAPAFLRAFAEEEGAAGRLRLGIAFDSAAPGSPPLAAQMWTVEGGTAFIHKLAYRESARALSPGSVLTAALMRHVIDIDQVREVDFGTGDDPYKRDWMETTRPRYRIEAMRPWALRNVPIIGRYVARGLAARLKRG